MTNFVNSIVDLSQKDYISDIEFVSECARIIDENNIGESIGISKKLHNLDLGDFTPKEFRNAILWSILTAQSTEECHMKAMEIITDIVAGSVDQNREKINHFGNYTIH